ncbi:MAG: cytochrome c, partial [Myxococcota bacterium]
MNFLTLSPLHHHLDRPGLAARALALGILLLIPARGAFAQPQAALERIEAEQLVFLLQYIAVDYGAAVQDGAVVNPFEYQEMRRFSQLLVEHVDDLQTSGAPEEIRTGILQLREEIRGTRPWTEVRALASDLAGKLVGELGLSVSPAVAPDLDRGRRFYGQVCATCHGASGGGDGPSAPGMDPPPTSLSDPRMNLVSPHQLYGAIKFGIEGTAMPSYEGELDPETIWDLSFFILTLRSGFAPRPPEQELPLTLADLARHSNEDLRALLRDLRVDADPGHIDYYRESPESMRPVAL